MIFCVGRTSNGILEMEQTNLTTTNRIVTYRYEAPGTYLTSVIVTYNDGTNVGVTKEVVVT